MKSCPEPIRLLEIANGRRDLEAEAHVRSCATCRSDLLLLRLLPEAVGARELAVPRELNERVMQRIWELAKEEERASLPQALVTGVLGTLTCAGALVVTGSAGAGTPTDLLLFSTAVGVGFGLFAALPGRRGGGFGTASPQT